MPQSSDDAENVNFFLCFFINKIMGYIHNKLHREMFLCDEGGGETSWLRPDH